MLSDKFFEAYAATADRPPDTGAEDHEQKTYTAAEVDALVNERVSEAIEEIKKSFSEPEIDPVERTNNHEENSREEA